MMAPYAIAHMKIGLKLNETGYKLTSAERVRVYLTNTLEPPNDHKVQREFEEWAPALAHEANAVNEVKRNQRFTVVMGNPPYSKLSQNQNEWITDLMERYKTTIKTEEIQQQALSNDYVKFFCVA
jgi:predicted helicase